MFAAKAALLDVERAVEYSATVWSQLFDKLLLRHKALTDEYQRVKTEPEKNAGSEAQIAELLKRVEALQAELKASAENHKDCIPTSELESQMQERNEAHRVQLQHEKDEVTRLRAELEKTQLRDAELEKTLAEEKQHREDEAQKHQELLSDTETRANLAERELATLKTKPGQWLSQLIRIHTEMDKQLPHSQPAASTATNKARGQKALAGPIPSEWDIDDHLTPLHARLSPLKIIGVDLLNAAIRVHKVLWPNTEAPKSVGELARHLQGSEDQLREWRSSCARAGADETLSYVLSWYEALHLDFQTMRAGSK